MIRKQQIHRNTAILHIPLIPSLQVLPCTHSRKESERERERVPNRVMVFFFFLSARHASIFCDYQRFMSFASSQLNAFHSVSRLFAKDCALDRAPHQIKPYVQSGRILNQPLVFSWISSYLIVSLKSIYFDRFTKQAATLSLTLAHESYPSFQFSTYFHQIHSISNFELVDFV